MSNTKNFLNVIFNDVSPQEVINWTGDAEAKSVHFNFLNNRTIYKLVNNRLNHLSLLEAENMVSYLKDECNQRIHFPENSHLDTEDQPLDVFSLLFYYTEDLLLIQNNEICCKYDRLLEWRTLTLQVSEDMLVSAYLANRNHYDLQSSATFGWPTAIGHNNQELNMIMKRGLAENHYHLKGSAPMFHLTWIALMNQMNENWKKSLEELEKNRQRVIYLGLGKYTDGELYTQIIQAALIRVYLFAKLTGEQEYLVRQDGPVGQNHPNGQNHPVGQNHPNGQNHPVGQTHPNGQSHPVGQNNPNGQNHLVGQNNPNGQNHPVGQENPAGYTADNMENYRKYVRRVYTWLKDPVEIELHEADIYEMITRVRTVDPRNEYPEVTDYAMYDRIVRDSVDSCGIDPEKTSTLLFWGERGFLYHMFSEIKHGNTLTDMDKNLFYAYLIIKENFRHEMLQDDYRTGFDNFAIYEGRKGYFVGSEDLMKHAIHDSLLSGNIRYLEARIVPWGTKEDLRSTILKNDAIIDADGKDREKFSYIYHFVKQPDTGMKELGKACAEQCRHYSLRKELRENAEAILAFRHNYPEDARRVVGIDACNAEIGCRPEVFAPVFRKLSAHTERYITAFGKSEYIPQLNVTYHVGEDFLDPADGLRAIDEAVNFLQLRCGDRLGHALALGIDVEEWYDQKKAVYLTAQDYLDNIAWIYFAMFKYNIPDDRNLKAHLLAEFQYYFRKIYSSNINHALLDSVLQEAAEYYDQKKIRNYYNFAALNFNIDNYIQSWELRGDDPLYYKRGYFCDDDGESFTMDTYRVNSKFPKQYDTRYIPEPAVLNYFYHYNKEVKKCGNRMIRKIMHPAYITAVAQIQKAMQRNIGARGIGIETNPTSNLVIGTFKRYDKHPIIKWYNHHIENDPELLDACPQLMVSINTDDQGIFSTKLENEYAFMALALEHARDSQGNLKYEKTMIYQWIEDIRRFSLDQNFIALNQKKNPARLLDYNSDEITGNQEKCREEIIRLIHYLNKKTQQQIMKDVQSLIEDRIVPGRG